MGRLFNMDIVSYLLGILQVSNSKELSAAALKTLIAISQRQKISHLIPAETIEKIQKLREHSGSVKISKLAQYFLGSIDSGPRPDRSKKWAVIDTAAVESLMEVNSPATLSRNELTNKFTTTIQRNKSPLPIPKPKVEPVLLEHKRNDRSLVAYTPEISLLNKTIDIAPSVPNYPLQPSYYQSKYSFDYQPRETIRRGLKSAIKKPNPMNVTIDNSSGTSQPFAKQKEVELENQTPPKKVRFTTEYNSAALPAKELKLPFLNAPQKISLAAYAGQDDILYSKHMDTDLSDKASGESKIARNLLGLGMIEVAGIKKATGCVTLRRLVEWYATAKDFTKAHSLILYGVVSGQRAQKVLGIIHLIATRKLGYDVKNPHITS